MNDLTLVLHAYTVIVADREGHVSHRLVVLADVQVAALRVMGETVADRVRRWCAQDGYDVLAVEEPDVTDVTLDLLDLWHRNSHEYRPGRDV